MITFSKVTKKFGNTEALSEISFRVDKGELVLLTGPSGSGKTSVMRLLIKEYEPSSGEIIFDGEPLAKVRGGGIALHRRRIGVVFQDYKLLPEMNVWENIALPLSIVGKSQAETESRVTDLLKLVGLAEKAMLFPSQLSGGEAQRVSIARALATGPGIIFADEPTGNLDPETSISIAKLLRQINRLGTTLLLTTHDNDVLALLSNERRLTLHKGVLAHDTHPKTDEVAEVNLTGRPAASSVSAESTPQTADHSPDSSSTAEVKPADSEEAVAAQSTAESELTAEVEDLDDDAVEISLQRRKPAETQANAHPAKPSKPTSAHKKTKHTSEAAA